MNENLKDAVDHWLQGQVNTCVAGLLAELRDLKQQSLACSDEVRNPNAVPVLEDV